MIYQPKQHVSTLNIICKAVILGAIDLGHLIDFLHPYPCMFIRLYQYSLER